jgi:exosortase
MKFSRRDIYFIAFSFALFVLMAESIRAVIEFAMDTENKHASQILLIPFISAALVFKERNNIFRNVGYSSLPGTVTMIAGAAIFVAGRTSGADLVEGDYLAVMASSVLIMWLGGFLFFYGTAAFRAARFPLLFLVFCIPIPNALLERTIAFLQHGSADMTYILLKLTGTPVYREGVVFTLPDLVIEVAPECSGIRSGISLLILSILAGHLMLSSSWKWGILVLATIPILLFKNAARISTLSLLALHVDKAILTSRLHREGGIPFFVLGLVLIYPVLAMLIRSERKKPGTSLISREAES